MNDSCPCKDCIYYVHNKHHPNPNAVDTHYCAKWHAKIYQHRGNYYHTKGQWIFPRRDCGGKDKPKEPIYADDIWIEIED